MFVSTSLSVGYADIFARTPTGQALATALNMFGPAMTGGLLEPTTEADATTTAEAKAEREKALLVQEKILEKLDAILGEMQKSRPV